MSYKHYIRIDGESRIVDGFSDYYREPQEGDIQITENEDKEFRLLGTYKNISLFFKPIAAETPVYLYKYVDGQIKERTQEELDADYPQLFPEPTDIDTLLELSADHEERLCLLELGV